MICEGNDQNVRKALPFSSLRPYLPAGTFAPTNLMCMNKRIHMNRNRSKTARLIGPRSSLLSPKANLAESASFYSNRASSIGPSLNRLNIWRRRSVNTNHGWEIHLAKCRRGHHAIDDFFSWSHHRIDSFPLKIRSLPAKNKRKNMKKAWRTASTGESKNPKNPNASQCPGSRSEWGCTYTGVGSIWTVGLMYPIPKLIIFGYFIILIINNKLLLFAPQNEPPTYGSPNWPKLSAVFVEGVLIFI